MKTRPGFTLVEVMVALVVTGVVVVLSNAALQAGLDTSERIDDHRRGEDASVVFRALVTDALRHAQPGVFGGDAVFVHADRVDHEGGAADSVFFLTRGIEEPAGASGVWQARIWREGDRLRFIAARHDRVAVSATLSRITSFDVQTLGRGPGAAWMRQWPEPSTAPQAVRLQLQGPPSSAPVGGVADVPIVVRIARERLQ
ncbi:MAG: prepilin-type N-terminal cleavage/methylation domain-containing protein [Gemmatimonadota bacterium]